MSLQDRLASQNASQLLSIGAGLGLITAASTNGKKYNFPLILFGLVAHEISGSNLLLRQFLFLLITSIFLDLWHLLFELSGLPLLLSLILLVLKGPILLSSMEILRQRGDTLQMPSYAGFPAFGQGVGGGGGGGYQQAEQGQGQASWNMPGGFGGGAPGAAQQAAPAPPVQFPSSGGFRLGGEEDTPPPNNGGGGGGQPGRGGYQTID